MRPLPHRSGHPLELQLVVVGAHITSAVDIEIAGDHRAGPHVSGQAPHDVAAEQVGDRRPAHRSLTTPGCAGRDAGRWLAAVRRPRRPSARLPRPEPAPRPGPSPCPRPRRAWLGPPRSARGPRLGGAPRPRGPSPRGARATASLLQSRAASSSVTKVTSNRSPTILAAETVRRLSESGNTIPRR